MSAKHERRRAWVANDLRRLQEWKAALRKRYLAAGDARERLEVEIEHDRWDAEYDRTKRIAFDIRNNLGEEWKN